VSLRVATRAALPALFAHEGAWDGVYRWLDADGQLADEHRTWTRCEFPDSGPYCYIQHNRMTWSDGRTVERSFGGVLEGALIRWDTDRFHGEGWETRGGVLMLRLEYRDRPGLFMIETITLAPSGDARARTWQWFEGGVPAGRTLCDEMRVSAAASA